MNTNSKIPEIRKEAFIKAREKLSLSTKELGVMACLSTRQIEQIESGETSSFYSAQIKATAAKKVANLLKLGDEEAFDFGATAPETSSEVQLPIAEVKLTDAPKIEGTKKAEAKIEAVKTQEQVQESQMPVAEKKVQTKEVPLNQVISKPKSATQKKLFLGLSVAAAAAFAVVNLQPVFSPEKPAEIVLVKEEIIEPVPAAAPVESVAAAQAPAVAAVVVPPAPAASAEATGVCPAEEGIISYKTDAPRKAADMVYVQVKSKQVVCVSDASGKMQNKLIEPGAGASFYGKPPFKVLTSGLAQADVFFQGAKVRLTNLNFKTLVLEAAEIAAPSVDRTDSQLR
ncbi:helix-turn-helix transcriptional regulator [Polynucleobacter sp. AP-Sving-400A-A2]|uniref:helix-turn-helix domain-containing protein n=1 Tax=Polynucleobacter sp. AP-Sving-400A-A2 TaxID=2081049 RepID=UPI001BFE12F2|nr:helix-turn-helix transcriptional regulator [Polynucleobacter sp. AP-Sving-400A-A2]QWE15122.1 helix-turn-helix transcriptional regulator [Polynucleobacter sp. AP-Sving-400A-A2]